MPVVVDEDEITNSEIAALSLNKVAVTDPDLVISIGTVISWVLYKYSILVRSDSSS